MNTGLHKRQIYEEVEYSFSDIKSSLNFHTEKPRRPTLATFLFLPRGWGLVHYPPFTVHRFTDNCFSKPSSNRVLFRLRHPHSRYRHRLVIMRGHHRRCLITIEQLLNGR